MGGGGWTAGGEMERSRVVRMRWGRFLLKALLMGEERKIARGR